MAKIEKGTVENLLSAIGSHLAEPTTICIVDSTAAILLGQPERQTPDIDVWGPDQTSMSGP